MKSTWVAAGLLLVTICQTENLPGAVPTLIPEWKITEINVEDDATPMYTICHDENLPPENNYIVNVITPATEYDLPGTIAVNRPTCLVVEDNIKIWSSVQINFVIHGVKGTGAEEVITGSSQTNFIKFPGFPETLKTSYGIDPLPTDGADNIILRVEGNLNGMSIYDIPSITDGYTINYYVQIKETREVRPCFIELPQVTVCDKVVDKGKMAVNTGPTAKYAILSYFGTDLVHLKSDVKSSLSTLMPITSSPLSSTLIPVSNQLEVIVATSNMIYSDLQLCITADVHKPCEIQWNGPGNNVAQMRVMGVSTTSHIMEELTKHTIQDRQVRTTLLSGGIVEGSWLMISENITYTLILKNASLIEISTVDVDCSKVTISHCFGYFLDVVTVTDYTITVKKKNNGDMQQVQSIPFSINKPLTQKDLQIHVLPMEWHQNLMEVNTTICFNHITPNEEMIFSHYEMLLINTRGQWLKHKVMEEDDNGDLCFTPFTVNTQEFDVTEDVKVVVSQRASDGFSVIASGGSTLF